MRHWFCQASLSALECPSSNRDGRYATFRALIRERSTDTFSCEGCLTCASCVGESELPSVFAGDHLLWLFRHYLKHCTPSKFETVDIVSLSFPLILVRARAAVLYSSRKVCLLISFCFVLFSFDFVKNCTNRRRHQTPMVSLVCRPCQRCICFNQVCMYRPCPQSAFAPQSTPPG